MTVSINKCGVYLCMCVCVCESEGVCKCMYVCVIQFTIKTSREKLQNTVPHLSSYYLYIQSIPVLSVLVRVAHAPECSRDVCRSIAEWDP